MKRCCQTPAGWNRLLPVLLLIILAVPQAKACDVCGCMAPFNAGGFLPVVRTNLFGIRYHVRSFEHPNTPLNYNGTSRVLHDHLHTAEIWLRAFPHKRLQFMASLPFGLHQRVESEQSFTITGPGDAQMQASWIAFMSPDSSTSPWKHGLMMGGDVQLPLGNYRQRDPKGTLLPHGFQTGSGSWGGGIHLNYTLRKGKFGLNADSRMRAFIQNESKYRPGWRASQQLQLFFWQQGTKAQWLPITGLAWEHYATDASYGLEEIHTGGNLIKWSLGLDLYVNRWYLSAHIQRSLWQEVPASQPEANWRFQSTLAWRF